MRTGQTIDGMQTARLGKPGRAVIIPGMRDFTVALLVAFVVACGGGGSDTKPPAPVLEPGQASTALLEAGELKGGGWSGQATEFGEAALARSPLCKAVSDFDRALIDSARGKAARAFQRTSSPVQVVQYVYVYENEEQAKGHVERFRGLGDWSECISFVLGDGTPGQRFTSSPVTPGGTLPPNTATRAFESRRTDGQIIRSVFFTWQQGNAVGWISVLGPPASLNDAFLSPVLNSAAAALRETAAGTRTPPKAGATPAPA
jgi:hypothetical protein